MLRRAVDELRPAVTIELDHLRPTQAADAAMRVERDRPVARSQRHQSIAHSFACDIASCEIALSRLEFPIPSRFEVLD
jgi:hypothetical protein